MKIIGGLYRSKKLSLSQQGIKTRPLMNSAKEMIFNILGQKLDDKEVLDLFGGVGNFGIEAISRGAKHAYIYDISSKMIQTIKSNMERINIHKQYYTLRKIDYLKALRFHQQQDTKFDVIFIDPPFERGFMNKALEFINNSNLLRDADSTLILHHSTKEILPDDMIIKYNVIKRKHGINNYAFLNPKQI